MADRLGHRGPDRAGLWSEGPLGLGHRLLVTTPESAQERLPARKDVLVLTADARIDNRAELIVRLSLTDRPPEGITDGALILAAYEQWGEDCPRNMIGDFAFAVWDGRRQTVFCARDHAGVKPFYYHLSHRLLAFASEIKALLTLPEVPRRLNELRVADHLTGLLEDQEITFYRDILRLPAGHSLSVGRGKARVQPYFRLDALREEPARADAEYAEAFRAHFTEAVRSRVRSRFPVGSLLSGGLDSSFIVGTAREAVARGGNGALRTFSAVFPGLPESDLGKIDERGFIRAVVGLGDLEPHYVEADRLSPLEDLDRVFWHEDEAFLAPNLYMHWALYRAAQGAGVRVLLDGLDGDTTVSHGLEYLAELLRAGRIGALMAEVTALAGRHGISRRRVFDHFVLRPLVPGPVRTVWKALRRRRPVHGSLSVPIRPAFARRVGLRDRIASLERGGSRRSRTARESHWQGLTSGLLPYTLELADRAAAAFGVEPRYPFFDRRLVEYCLALPPEQKLHGGWTRVVERRAMAGLVPEEVRWRVGKGNLSPNFKRGLFGDDRHVVEDVIVKDPQVIDEYVDVAALRDAFRRHASGPIRDADALDVYAAVTLALWLRRTGLSA
jgi:asparagine synthase (glutamine-hydrolysing)